MPVGRVLDLRENGNKRLTDFHISSARVEQPEKHQRGQRSVRITAAAKASKCSSHGKIRLVKKFELGMQQ